MARLKLSRAASFWLLATVFAFFLFAAGAPSPLYVVYEAMWHFSSLTLTAIFGVYALALLAALLTTGRLSDHLGRRLVVLLAGVLAFIAASSAGWPRERSAPGWLICSRQIDRAWGAWSAVSRRSAAWRLARGGRACWYNMAPTHCTWCTRCCWLSSCPPSPPCRSCRT